MKLKKCLGIILCVTALLSFAGCAGIPVTVTETEVKQETVNDDEKAAASGTADSKADCEAGIETDSSIEDIKIVYTNDVHSYIDNVDKDSEGNVIGDGLRFSKIAAMVSDMRAANENVILVDAGDEIQGGIYGAMDEGSSVIDIMNATGYQLATPGNHDFDYGVFKFFEICDKAEFPYITCNFHSTRSKEKVFDDTKIFDIGGKKVAFVGISTPDTITSTTPVYFQDDAGNKIYDVDGIANITDLYTSVQNAIDSVRDEADYVIALGHVGVGIDAEKEGTASDLIIANVSGLDAFIDGHSHSTIEGKRVKDKDGKDVVLTQTGCYLNAVGIMTISKDGTLSTELINDYDREDESVAELENSWIQQVFDQMNEQIAVLDTSLYINNPEDVNQRLIRAKEMNSGDFVADSIYWFFNEKLEIDCDVAFMNAGGIRAQLEKGNISYMDAKSIVPYGNMICLISAKGQQIKDALEMGCTVIGEWDDEWNAPAENGGFLQVAGLKYSIDSSIESGVKTDSNGLFVSVEGDYRVKDVQIFNRETGKYDDIDLNREYLLAGINYMLRNSGDGLSMFAEDDLKVDYVGQDYVILSEYFKSFKADGEYPKVNSSNSPLSSYTGYLLDYENPYGSGRITYE